MTTQQTTGINIPFSQDNIKKCRCTICPVQTDSQCVADKARKIQDTLKNRPLNPQDIPNVYCSQGVASCKDIDTDKPCLCFDCLVYSGYNLASAQPDGKYCRDGKAHK